MGSVNKAAPMTKDETMLLVQLVEANKIINNKSTNAKYNKMKDQAWENLSIDFNSSISRFPRTPAQLRLKWENLKKSARKRCSNMTSRFSKIGGGDDSFPSDDVLDRVASLLSSSYQHSAVEFLEGVTLETPKVEEHFIEIDEICNAKESNDGSINEGEVMKPSEILKTSILSEESRRHESRMFAKRRLKIEEDKGRARIYRDTAWAEYLLSKKKKIDIENEKQEVLLAKLKLELENAKMENIKLKKDLNLL